MQVSTSLSPLLLLVNNTAIDREQRSQLEAQKTKLEQERQHFAENLRRVESELNVVEQMIKDSEEDKRTKVDTLYRSFRDHGILGITSS